MNKNKLIFRRLACRGAIVRYAFGLFFAGLTLLLSSCVYYDYASTYEKMPDASESMLEVSEMTIEEQAERLDRLKTISMQPYPEYRIDVGDMLVIKVYNNPELEVTTQVTPDGHVGLMFLGQVKVSGLTLTEAAKKIEDGFAEYIKNPRVGISPTEIRSQSATISGAVAHPGVYPVNGSVRLGDIFALAGGGATRMFDGQVIDAADFVNSVLIRNNEIIPVDFQSAIQSGDPVNNIRMQKGDYVYVAVRTEKMISIIGEVKSPRFQMWNPNLGLLEAITNSGGLTDMRWKYVIIMRGGFHEPKFYRADIESILRGQKPNVPLQPGDIVYVPKDAISEYNVFIRKLMPTAQLVNMLLTPAAWLGGF